MNLREVFTGVAGNTCTAGGLTVTLTRESGSDFALDAGALVLADQVLLVVGAVQYSCKCNQ